LEFVLPTQRVVIAVLIGVVVSLVAAFFPAIRAARIRILDAIHYE
jgi:ABC-type antimicrobial peptide transport system permease subunit